MRENPLMKRPAYRAVWIEMLLEAEHGMKNVGGKWQKKEPEEMKSTMWKGERIFLKAGQFTCGAKQMSEWTGVPRGTVERIIKVFVKCGMIEEQASNKFSLFTVKKWKEYQQDEEQVRNKRGTSEEQVRTPKECKNDKNEKNVNKPLTSDDVVEIKKSSSKKKNKTDPMSRQEFMEYMKQGKRKALHIIADWADTLKPEFTTWGQWDVFMRRNLRPAADLESFSQQQIIGAYGEIMTDSNDGEKFKPTLETLIKYLTK